MTDLLTIIEEETLKTRGNIESRSLVGVASVDSPSRMCIHFAATVPDNWPEWGVICIDEFNDDHNAPQLKKYGYTAEMLFSELYETHFMPPRKEIQDYTLEDCVEAGPAVHIEPGARVGVKSQQAVWMKDYFIPFPHVKGVKLGPFVWIGANVVIERGTLTDTVIGTGVRIGANSTIGAGAEIGSNNIIPPGTRIAAGVQIPPEKK